MTHPIKAFKDVDESQNQASAMNGGMEVDPGGNSDKCAKKPNESLEDDGIMAKIC